MFLIQQPQTHEIITFNAFAHTTEQKANSFNKFVYT